MVKELKIFGKQVLQWGEPPEVSKSKIPRSMKGALAFYNDRPKTNLPLKQMREIILTEPMLYKAIQKKNLDIVRNWFIIKPVDDDEEIDKKVLDVIYTFDKRVQFPYKLFLSGVCANIYGTGFLERTFIEPSNISIDSDINENREPLNLLVKNSEHITSKEPKTKGEKKIYWVYQEGTEKTFIHPNRLIDYATDRLPFSSFGISKVNIVRNSLRSKMEGDVASGDTLAWASHGIVDTTIQDMQDDQEKSMAKLYEKRPSAYAHDQTYEVKVHNPTAIDPKPFYDYFYTNIAAVMVMPTHMLTGAELGNVTGSEVGFGAYIHDVENIQKVILTPIIEKIYKQLLKSKGMIWKYKIVWNPIFIDELTEAKITQVRSYSAVNNYNAGIIDIVEARRMLNDGVVNLDVKKVPEPKELPEIPVDQPNTEPQPTDKKPTVKQKKVYPLEEEQKRMINEAAKRERILGEKILKEQEILYDKKQNKKNRRNKRMAKKKKS